MPPRVAIAMSVYNDAARLPLALAALEAQTFRDYQLTLLDDGSTDESRARAEAFSARLPMTILAAQHRGRHDAKRAAADAALDVGNEFLLVLDADIAMAKDTLARMVRALDGDPGAAVISAHARAPMNLPYGAGQAFLEDVYLHTHAGRGAQAGQGNWIVGGCALFRAEVLRGLDLRGDLPEDSELSQQLRARWRLLLPLDLVVEHHGVPTSLRGLLRRGERDGVRVCSLLRVHPEARDLGNLARLVPLPLALLFIGCALARTPLAMLAVLALGVGYLAAFIDATRAVPAPLSQRFAGALTFAFCNLGFGVGYLRESLRGAPDGNMREPARKI